MTEAEFLRFLRQGDSKVAVICEIQFAYESGGSMTTGTLYFADRPEAVSGSQPYKDAIESAPELQRAIDLARLGGRGSRTSGSITINNCDGAFDYLLDVIIDGRDAEILIGGKGWARADYRTLCVGAVAAVRDSGTEITIELRDKNFGLDATVIGSPITSGPNEGKPNPLLLGEVRNFDITPYLLDQANLIYSINDFPLHSSVIVDRLVYMVRDAGISLLDDVIFSAQTANTSANAGTNTITRTTPHGLAVNDVLFFEDFGGGTLFTGLSGFTQYWVIAAGLTATDFRLSLTKGGAAVDITGTSITGNWDVIRARYYIDVAAATIELSATPEGRVTLDMRAIDAAGDLDGAEPHAVFKYLLDNYAPDAIYDEASIDALAALQTGQTRYGLAILDRANLLPLLDGIAEATLSWYAWMDDGELAAGKLDLANLDGETAIDTIGESDIIGELTAENLPLPWGLVVMDTDPNSTVQTDGLAAAVAPESRTQWVKKHQLRVTTTDPGTTAYLANWWDYHKSAIDSRPVETSLVNSPGGGSQDMVDEMTELFAPWTRVHRCTVGIDKYALNPGDCVTLTYPRYGLTAGKNCRVISIRPKVSERVCELVLVRQAQPDYTAATH